jgi:putative ABC transport system permease protein
MNILALKEIGFRPLRFLLAACGVAFLITGCIGIAGLYRGIVHDALFIIDSMGGDLWLSEAGRVGPLAEPSAISPTLDRRAEGVAGVREARRFVQNNLQFDIAGHAIRIAVTGLDFPKDRGEWVELSAGRFLAAAHDEAIADQSLGLAPGQVVRLGHDDYTIVGLTHGQVDMLGDGLLFVSIRDALDIASARPSEAVLLDRAQGLGTMADRPARLSAVVVKLQPGANATEVAARFAAWGDVTVLTADQQRSVLVDGRLWRLRLQILFFAVLLMTVTGVVIAMTIYNSTVEKLHQIALLKLIGARDSFILAMIVQQALLIGIAAYAIGLVLSHLVFPYFPRQLELLPADLAAIFAGLMTACVLGSWFGISRALRVRAKEVLA